MTLWTIQSLSAWTELQNKGVLRAKTDHVMVESWLPAYRWMTHQMRRRLGPPPEADCQPVWAWYRWDAASAKPDLRCRGHLDTGEQGVRLKLEYPSHRALLSDFSDWHHVLNYWYLPLSEAEGEAFESELASHGLSFFSQKPLPYAEYHRAIVESWDRIFDPELDPKWGISIQATLWEITLDQVRECRHFTAR